MGPLVPQGIISTEFNYVIALLIGIAFGFVLEQAGFSNSKKLAGVFYGYDFVVLRVFFTAAVTAVLGITFLNYFGFIDASMLYINPLYLWPAIIGGAIMGVGFILGGFCPGTSITGIAIGKIDAIFFFGGLAIGIFIFAEAYPAIENLFLSKGTWQVFDNGGDYLGKSERGFLIYEALNMSRGWFVFLLTSIAIIAFVVTAMIEAKSSRFESLQKEFIHSKAGVAAILAIVLSIISISFPTEKQNRNEVEAEVIALEISNQNYLISLDEVAYRLMHNDENLQMIDVRSAKEFKSYAIPASIHIPLDSLLMYKFEDILKDKSKEKVIYANNEEKALDAWKIARREGYGNIYILKGGINNWVNGIFNPIAPKSLSDIKGVDQYKFRKEAKKYFFGGQK